MSTSGGFSIFDKRWVRPNKNGGFDLALPAGVTTLLHSLVGQLDELLDSDASVTWRLFPTAYPDDEEAERDFQSLIRDDLMGQHKQAAQVVAATLTQTHLSEDELAAWMRNANALRLVLGTILEVSDEEPLLFDPTSPQATLVSAYEVLGHLVDQIVTALSQVG